MSKLYLTDPIIYVILKYEYKITFSKNMCTIKNILFLCTLGLSHTSCSIFDQNDFISTQKVGQIGEEIFLYSAFQTGIDNYRIEFKVAVGTDTTKLFDFFINDALYTKENSFHFQTSHDTLIISTPFQLCKSYQKTRKGTTIEITNNTNANLCQDLFDTYN